MSIFFSSPADGYCILLMHARLKSGQFSAATPHRFACHQAAERFAEAQGYIFGNRFTPPTEPCAGFYSISFHP